MTARDEHGRSGANGSPEGPGSPTPHSRAAARRAQRAGSTPNFGPHVGADRGTDQGANRGAAPSRTAGPAPVARSAASEAPRARSLPVVAISISAAGALIAALALALVLWRPAPGPLAPAPAPGARSPSASAPSQRVEAPPATAERRQQSPERVVIGGAEQVRAEAVSDPSGLQRVFREVVARAEEDAEAARSRFESAAIALGDSWPRFERATVSASVDEASRALGAVAQRLERPEEALDSIARDAARLPGATRIAAHEVWRVAFAVGMCARAANESELPSPVRERARAAVIDAIGEAPPSAGAFWAGASAALVRMPRLLVGLPDAGDAGAENAWRRWLDAVESAMWDAPRAREETLVDAAEILLEHASAREPDVSTRSIIGRVLDEVDFSANGAGRRAVIRWLDEVGTIATRELAATIQHIARQRQNASLAGVELLSSAASDDERGRFRDLLSSRWALSSPAFEASIRSRWRNALSAALADDVDAADDSALLERASRLSWISAAAAAVWRGDAQAATIALSRAERLDFAASPPASSVSLTSPVAPVEGDGRWAARYLAARRNATERQRVALELASSSTPLGPIDSEVLAEAALLGAPSNVRDAASRAVERRAGDPAMAAALLEMLPRTPRTIAAGRLYSRAAAEPLPPVRDAAWPLETRRALVARMLRSISADLAPGAGDLAAKELGESYAVWTSVAASVPMQPDEAARLARAAIRRDAIAEGSARGHARLDDLDRRLIARRALATGPVQAFLAEQAGVVETMALLASETGQSRAGRAREITARHADETRAATHAAQQVEAGERAIAALWSIRLGVEAAP